MAFIDENNKIEGNEDENQNQGQGGDSGQISIGGGDSQVVGANQPQAQGTGGQGGWTNIQAYLNANPASQSKTDESVERKIGGVFDSDRSKLQSESKSALDQGSGAFKSYSNQDLDKMINRQVGGDNTAQSEVSGYLNSQYSGPDSFAYGLSKETQDYGNRLDSNFDSILENIYNENAGGQMSAGQLALQRQLDIGNTDLTKTRQGLKDKYSNLNEFLGTTVGDTNQQLKQFKTDYGAGQTSARNYLTGQQDSTQNAYQTAVNRARENYQSDYKGRDLLPNNSQIVMTPEMYDQGYALYNGIRGPLNMVGSVQSSAPGLYNQFLNNARTQYGGVGSAEAKRYNAIAQFLGLDDSLDDNVNIVG